jgi:hypothetical protein
MFPAHGLGEERPLGEGGHALDTVAAHARMASVRHKQRAPMLKVVTPYAVAACGKIA